MQMDTSIFLAKAKSLLTESYLARPGCVLYSAPTTLTRGRFYILGLNPGGDESNETVGSSLDALLIRDASRNRYLDDPWEYRGKEMAPGKHPLQARLREFARDYLCVDLAAICASNLIFFQSKNDRIINLHHDGRDSWPVHQLILGIVRPSLILTIGNGPKSAFEFIRVAHGMTANWRPVNRAVAVKTFEAELETSEGALTTRVLGLPHLSRHDLSNVDSECRDWMRERVAC
jgi:hypothetical protein